MYDSVEPRDSKIRAQRILEQEKIQNECTFKPHFYTKPETRKNAQAKRKSQVTLMLELEYGLGYSFRKNSRERSYHKQNSERKKPRRIVTTNEKNFELPESPRGAETAKNNIMKIEFTKDLGKEYTSHCSPPQKYYHSRSGSTRSPRETRSGSQYEAVQSRVYDHLGQKKYKKVLKHQKSLPSFTPKLWTNSRKIARGLESKY